MERQRALKIDHGLYSSFSFRSHQSTVIQYMRGEGGYLIVLAFQGIVIAHYTANFWRVFFYLDNLVITCVNTSKKKNSAVTS